MSGGALGSVNPLILPGTYTVATLPPVVDNVRKYAWASDLFGGPGDYCISDGVNWKPVRPLAFSAMPVADMALTALLMPPTIIFNGTSNVLKTVTFSTQYAYSGAKFRTLRKSTGIGALLVNGIGLNLNSWADNEYDATTSTWVQTGSGGLL